jgi:hypothetical protein
MFFYLKRAGLLPLFALLLILTACNDDPITTSTTTPVAPRVEIRLTDEPGDYEKVIIDVVDIQVKFDGDWIDLDTDYTGSYDLIELTAGVDTLLAVSNLPAGELKEVRLILGDDNFVQIDSILIPLRTPSAQQSGLKIKLENALLQPDLSYTLLLDFDAGRSVVRAGNSGNYNLKPVIRAELFPTDQPGGAIAGIVNPAEGQYVFAYQTPGDTLGTYANDEGIFRFVSIPAGSYTVEVTPPSDTSAYGQRVLQNVLVTDGDITDLGVIVLD